MFNEDSLIFKDKTIYEKDLNQFIRIKSLLTNDKLNNIELLKKSVFKWETQRDNARNQKEYEYLNNLVELSNAIIKADIL